MEGWSRGFSGGGGSIERWERWRGWNRRMGGGGKESGVNLPSAKKFFIAAMLL